MSGVAGNQGATGGLGQVASAIDGVELAAVEAGVRYPDRRDLVALRLAPGTRAAALFTRNAFCAAPVQVAREHLVTCAASPRLLLVNTGNANAGTGAAGLAAARECCAAAAAAAGVDPAEVLPFSTGVIGEDLPVERITAALPRLLEACHRDGWDAASWGILTTDTKPKLASRSIDLDGRRVRLTGMAKGAGMLRPDMATMLAFIATDAAIAAPVLDALLRRAADKSFHRITVDGDTSTNDALVLVATGAAGNAGIEDEQAEPAQAFGEALDDLCIELARGLVRDGEGVTRLVTVDVSAARSSQEALDVAFTVAHSPLVKTALFAGDPNWGRILAAVGRAGIEDLDVEGVRITLGGEPVAEAGARAPQYNEERVAAVMAREEIELCIELGRGAARETIWTSDLSYDYVKINAEYRS
ncbi:MAG: bifunctional glutamate N-acetyltransferase/amino-acid acetyltransferase ArgJ [Halieaceae bacterium]|nr:bifunctional glutamate N-acetyltransferase/amino-acid acetyltransferase ArgJ [Halieaceae bacterium]